MMKIETKNIATPVTAETYLRCISEGDIGETDGSKTLTESGEIFKAGIDPDFKKLEISKPGKPAGAMHFNVYEMVKRGMFTQFIGSMFCAHLKDGANVEEIKIYIEKNHESLRGICMKNDDQIIDFVQKHPDKLCKDGYTFFLRECEEINEFFLIGVRIKNNQFFVGVCQIALDQNVYEVFFPMYFVFPKQKTCSSPQHQKEEGTGKGRTDFYWEYKKLEGRLNASGIDIDTMQPFKPAVSVFAEIYIDVDLVDGGMDDRTFGWLRYGPYDSIEDARKNFSKIDALHTDSNSSRFYTEKKIVPGTIFLDRNEPQRELRPAVR